MQGTIFLLRKTSKKNNIGDEISTVEELKRIAEIKSIGQREAYQASARGLKLEFTAIIWKFEYKNEEVLKYNGKEYRIQRTYERDDEKIELVCGNLVNNEENIYGGT